jgi:hypothetical protein
MTLAVLAPCCAHSFDVENRETRVNVWLTAPHLAAEGGTLYALIYVGPYKVVEGPVKFTKGGPTVNLPPLYIRGGNRKVTAVLAKGRFNVATQVEIEEESWIQVVLSNGKARIDFAETQPNPWSR